MNDKFKEALLDALVNGVVDTSESIIESEKDLKPCPFCSGSEIVIGENRGYMDPPYFFGYCRNCGVQAGGSRDKEQARDNWNTRPGEK